MTEISQEAVDSLRGELREEKEYAAALEESKADAERLLSKEIGRRVKAEEERNRLLIKALAEGHGVEDGGIWEDRALKAEAKCEAIQAQVLAEVRERLGPWVRKLDGWEINHNADDGGHGELLSYVAGLRSEWEDILATLNPNEGQ